MGILIVLEQETMPPSYATNRRTAFWRRTPCFSCRR